MIAFNDQSIRAKLTFFFLITLVIGLVNGLGVLYFLSIQKDDAAVIDAAGRNRMLSQRVAYLAELARKQPSAKEELRSSIELLHTSLNALKTGGVAPGIAEDRELPETPKHILPALAEAEELWLRYKNHAELLLSHRYDVEGPSSDSTHVVVAGASSNESLAFIESNASVLLTKFNGLVKLYVRESEQKLNNLKSFLTLLFVLTLGLVMIGVWSVNKFISHPLQQLRSVADELANGKLSFKPDGYGNDEIGKVMSSMNRLFGNMEKASTFAHEIAKGDFVSDYQPASDDDNLGKALIYMRDKLKEVAVEDKKRNWSTEGLAKFSEILRNDQGDLEEVSNRVLSSLVKYMNANQGGLFIVNDDEPQNPHLELLAMYAWDRKRFLKKRFEQGEGLAGQAWLEREMIYLKEVPKNYIEITSGLGMTTPKSIVIVPLKLNDEIFGILEIASLREYEKFELEFVTRLSETIASTLSSAKINQRTKKLLEQSQIQAEGLRAQEEELRQNMEEIQATQEEMRRKGIETESRLQAIDESGVASIEFNLDGTIAFANKNFLRLMEYEMHEIQGKHHRIFVDPVYAASPEYKKFWEDLANGIPRPGEYTRVTRSGNKVAIQGSYSIIRDSSGNPVRILKLAVDITRLYNAQEEIKKRAKDVESRLAAIDDSGVASIEFDLKGTILKANDNFLKLMEYSLDEIQGKHHRIFVDPAFAKSIEYKLFWDDLSNGVSRPDRYERITKTGKKIWIQGSYSILRDESGRPTRILKLANQIAAPVNQLNPTANDHSRVVI